MKYSSLLRGIILAAWLVLPFTYQASAQYSSNVVGYYNVQLTPGWNLMAIQLLQLDMNANNVLPAPAAADGSLLYRFSPSAQEYYRAATYLSGVGWYPASGNTNDPALQLYLGDGFFIWTPQAWVATLVGEVVQGSLTNPLPPGFSLRASIVPQEGLLQRDLIFPPRPADTVWRWQAQAFSPSTYNNSAWQPSDPLLKVGEGFFLYRQPEEATRDHWWVRYFIVQFAPDLVSPGTAQAQATGGQTPAIRSLSLRNGKVSLAIQNDRGAPYNVQFSPDGASWQTVASSQTALLWQEPARAGSRGYYQLVNP